MGKFDIELERLKRALMSQLNSAKGTDDSLHYIDADESWRPVPAQCHDNVDRWVLAHPGDHAQRGWLLEPFADVPHRFVAHSVVRTTAGDLLDVTLSASKWPRQFLPHPGDAVGFFALLLARPDVSILVVPPDESQ